MLQRDPAGFHDVAVELEALLGFLPVVGGVRVLATIARLPGLPRIRETLTQIRTIILADI
ncbi:MAG: hypothetical protein EOO25_01380 [Comamonadaceae bacterium]|nr:MAG: hypothetical protein EOO25_01380 [Comamonadaceae bacterium]